MPVYTPNFKHDIFVSYSHADNQIMEGAEKGWVTTFINTLKIELGKQLGRGDAYSLWMDYKLSGNESVTPDIDQQLNNCAIFLFILSPAYLASEWCILELNTFFSKVYEDSGRIFMVENSFIPREEKLPEFQELLGYQFWIEDTNTGIHRTLGIPKPNPDREPDYYLKVQEVATQITKKLKQLKAETLETDNDTDTLATLDRLHFENEINRLKSKKTGKVEQLKSVSTAMSRPNVPDATRKRLNNQLQQFRIDIDELDEQIAEVNVKLAKLGPKTDSVDNIDNEFDLATLDKLHLENEKSRLSSEKIAKNDMLQRNSIGLSKAYVPDITRERLTRERQQLRSDVEELDARIAEIERELEKFC